MRLEARQLQQVRQHGLSLTVGDLAQGIQQIGGVAGGFGRAHPLRDRGRGAEAGIFNGLGHNGIATNCAFTIASHCTVYNL
jgi:hypothetical protein